MQRLWVYCGRGVGGVPDADDVHLADTPTGGTRMTLRNQGEPSGFGQLAAPAMTTVMATAMRRANRKDLQALKSLLEDTATFLPAPQGPRVSGGHRSACVIRRNERGLRGAPARGGRRW